MSPVFAAEPPRLAAEWLSHCYTVRKPTPANRHGVAKVARNLRSQKSSLSILAAQRGTSGSPRNPALRGTLRLGKRDCKSGSFLPFQAFGRFTSFAGIRDFAPFRLSPVIAFVLLLLDLVDGSETDAVEGCSSLRGSVKIAGCIHYELASVGKFAIRSSSETVKRPLLPLPAYFR
jgi:hypothetical protein